MNIRELIRMVIINMRKNAFRAILTSLGVIVGTITIVMVIAIGQGGEEKAAAQFSGLSADTIYVNVNYEALSAGTQMTKEDQLTEELVKQILEESVALQDMYLRSSLYTQITIGGEKDNLALNGVTRGYIEISNLFVEFGADFGEEDYESGTKVAVIGNGLARKYFVRPEYAIDQYITINGAQYRIIGVLERNQDGLQGLSPDETVFIPHLAMQGHEDLVEYSFNQLIGKTRSIADVQLAMREIKSTLNYRLNNGALYAVEDAGSRIKAATESARNMKMLLVSVACIVLIVSGIGIMNVLFVTIKERTREIGILGALGMRKGDILMQFLMESMLIGVLGGLLGVFLSTFGLQIIKIYSDIPIAESWEGKGIALAFAIITGTAFGLYPAYKAAALKPVEALGCD